ncbi:MAG TPA: thiamine pyrophosphate-dependent enzyme, partial [Desulfobacterales bacterium]|nr:thiamine pyrophosphate-dependent enzyme [Desulfobacterales bacterium]
MTFDRDLGLSLYGTMLRIRAFEEKLYFLFSTRDMPGSMHQYNGEEAVAAGVCAHLGRGDWITSTHRGHGHCIAKGADLNAVMAEMFAKSTGCCRGMGGSMHIADFGVGMLGANGIVAAGIPIAVGAALAERLRGAGAVAVAFFGDGAANEGAFHEAVNFAAVGDLPAVFVCENNLYGFSTHYRRATKVEDFASRAAGYGIPGVVVDGMDVRAVWREAGEAIARARAGGGPTLLEAKTYRYMGHSRFEQPNYRTKDEVADWKRRDPIASFRAVIAAELGVGDADIAAIDAAVAAEIETAVRFAEASPDPAPADYRRYLWAAPPLPRDEAVAAALQPPAATGREPARTIVQALRTALIEEMERDPAVFLLGEDIAVFGGSYRVTEGLLERFGSERVRDTPISEAAIVGAAIGAAMTGRRPVAEIQFNDFLTCAMDQVCNQAAKMRFMMGGQVSVPIVIRAPFGATGRAAQHSQSLEAWFLHTPGLKVVMPSTPYDAKGLLAAAIRDPDPVLFFEHKLLYGGGSPGGKAKTAVDGLGDAFRPAPAAPYVLPLGVADVKRPGRDVTVVATGLMVHHALRAAADLAVEGIEVEVVDLRTLVPLDTQTILESVGRTGRLV